MEDEYIGVIKIFAGNFEPKGWMFCDGRSLPIGQNQGLFALIGNIYGGDSNNFNLPDLRGRVVAGLVKVQIYQTVPLVNLEVMSV